MKINKIIMYIMQQGTKVVDYSRRWVYCPSEACVVSPEGIIDITFVLHIVLYSRLNCVVTLFLEKWDLLSYRHFNKNIPQRKLSRPGFRPQGPGQKQRRTTARPAQRPLQRRLLLEVLAIFRRMEPHLNMEVEEYEDYEQAINDQIRFESAYRNQQLIDDHI
ncbi:uncharacterized protein LOC107981492 isoform X3 [Nasonia vitripennis]|uniref:Uncharacterized protein n=1 Tax=Nasonia vitripennis TaxID=7425 RepID=A0A7M7Q971_NASVI|nr:uncharacterized protein LOC107981492 isoform X3 [Nasonia vitripennis]